MMRKMILNSKNSGYLLLLVLFIPMMSYSQNINVQDLQNFQSLVDDNSQRQQDPLQQPGLTQDKNQITEQEMMILEEEEKENSKRQKPINLTSMPETKLLNSKLKPFGYDLFSESPTTFAPATDIPVSPNYIIGPGDNIEVILFGKQNNNYTLQVTREGEVYFPSIGPIPVAGLTFDEMQKVLMQRINNQIIGVEASITLGVLKSIQVFVLGEAYQPGSYTISALSTLTNALFASGGVKDNASLRKIKLNRKGETIVDFDLYDLLLKGDTSKDQRLQSGDVIFIPTLDRSVGIDGEIRRPGTYELIENETVEDLINFAGGLTPRAHKASAQIERVHSYDGITLLDADLNSQEVLKTELYDGDILYAYPISNIMQDVILISGYFNRPGFYQWKENLKLSDLINSSDDLLPNVDTNYVVIKRENPKDKTYSALQADISEFINNDNTQDNFELKSRDEIFFFSTMLMDTDDSTTESKEFLRKKIIELGKEKAQLELQAVEDKNSFLQAQQQPIISPEDEMLQITLLEDLIDNDLEMLVMKDNVVKIIRKDALNVYETQGFIRVDTDEEMLEEAEMNVAVLRGDRTSILSPFIKVLKRQGRPGKPTELVRVDGSVLFPGEYPFTPGMTVQDAINAGGGLKDNTYIDDLELTRLTLSDKEFISSRDNVPLSQMATRINPGDRLLIKGALTRLERVMIEGEVYFPGEYILKNNETLSDLIQRAGGLTNDAFLPASFFQRESLRKAQVKRLKAAKNSLQQEIIFQSTRAGDVGSSEGNVAQLMQLINMTNNEEEEAAGRLIFDLKNILQGNEDDLVLQHQDRIVIPQKPQSVSVIGEVYVPSSHIFDRTGDLSDYLRLSGGVKPSAEEDAIYIIKSNGSIVNNLNSSGFFRASSSSGIEPGDTIVIPFKTSTFSGLRATQDVTQIVYELAVAAAAISSFN